MSKLYVSDAIRIEQLKRRAERAEELARSLAAEVERLQLPLVEVEEPDRLSKSALRSWLLAVLYCDVSADDVLAAIERGDFDV